MYKIFLGYIQENKLFFAIGFYLLFSAILKAITKIDICIPCLWNTFFDIHCPGCGLTTAFIYLIKLNFNRALESNWMIFIILPIIAYYLKSDFNNYQLKIKK